MAVQPVDLAGIPVGHRFDVPVDHSESLIGLLPNLAVQPVEIAAPDTVSSVEDHAWLNAPLDDIGNGERFCIDHCRYVRYIPGRGWHVWNGARWIFDEDGAIQRLAKQTAKRIREVAADCASDTKSDDEALKNKARAWQRNRTRATERRGLIAILDLAKVSERVVATADAMDANLETVNALNGTIDLATGELHPHSPADLNTKLAPIRYAPDARSDRFEQFLGDLTGGDPELAAYLQRAAGYTATGHTSEEIFFFGHGPEATGKTTLARLLGAALGDYSRTASASTFMTSRQAGATPDLARLVGARYVSCSEIGPNAKFTPEVIKATTGGDEIYARPLYRDGFQYTPQFKLWFFANELPAIEHDDGGMWRRVHTIPFIHTIPATLRDPDLKRQLTTNPADLEAILAWIVAGAVSWKRDGLQPPDAVTAYTDAYRAENDRIAEWLAHECHLDGEHRTTRHDARRAYEAFCAAEGEQPVSTKAFVAALRSHGITEAKIAGTRCWKGLHIHHGALGARGARVPEPARACARTHT